MAAVLFSGTSTFSAFGENDTSFLTAQSDLSPAYPLIPIPAELFTGKVVVLSVTPVISITQFEEQAQAVRCLPILNPAFAKAFAT
jgi:hypothetical protein